MGGMVEGKDPGLNVHCGEGICTSSIFIRCCSFCPGLEMLCWPFHVADCPCDVKPRGAFRADCTCPHNISQVPRMLPRSVHSDTECLL